MILTDREIRIAIQEEQIKINPLPDLSVAIVSTAMDLTLGSSFKTWPKVPGLSVRPHAEGCKYSEFAKLQVPWTESLHFPLKPKNFVLAWTAETVELPHTSRIGARVEGKSSLARLGISVHITAPTIHAGFKGEIQLELFNFGENEVILDPGMWVCQLIFEQTYGTPDRGYDRGFSGQSSKGLQT
jgi:dCTP deaminase